MKPENIYSFVINLFSKQLNLRILILKNQCSKKIKEINHDIMANNC